MDFFTNMLSVQLMLFCLIVAGILIKKIGVISDAGRKVLSDLLINVILPCNIVHSFMSGTQVSGDFLRNCILMVVISALVQVAATYGSRLLFKKYPRKQKSVLSYGLISSNSSFVGLPIAETLFGSLGVMYTSFFQIPIRFTIWTAGLALFTSVDRKGAFRKLARHPCIVSIFIGLLMMVLPIQLPAFLDNTISAISKCTTPISMFVIGSILADASIRSLFSKSVLYYTFLRLLALPLLVYLALLPFHLDSILVGIAVLMTGMPAGSTGAVLADQYDCDAPFYSQLIFTSTLFSILTIPLLTLLI
ncbi:AEC family transporter [uncultured Dysosmobacter sp.]|uniref:AEC family transporter n=1 Tax=uncultured Dysosmobacter sp. TaxID=2591384 RepID=UPI0026034DE0|nr:AEC family transporter [uncultured Dysosmobacter sp.]